MGIAYSTETLDENPGEIYKIMTYNVEWGFLDVPKDISVDSCGHPLPKSKLSSETHLTLISKNIGLILETAISILKLLFGLVLTLGPTWGRLEAEG